MGGFDEEASMTTDAKILVLLRKRAITVRLRGKSLDGVIDQDFGPPGLFMPPQRHRKTNIFLKTGRTDRQTLFTLCHELGHFWAYATNRRTASYGQALLRYQVWKSNIASKARNAEAVLRYPTTSDVPKEVYARAWEEAEAKNPNPLSGEEKHEILAEEARAWCFGVKIAIALGVADTDDLYTEANAAMGFYYQRLKVPSVEWTPTSCNCDLTPEDTRFVGDLSASDPGSAS